MRRFILVAALMAVALIPAPGTAAAGSGGLIYANDIWNGGYGSVAVRPDGSGFSPTCAGDPTSASPTLFLAAAGKALTWAGAGCNTKELYNTNDPNETLGAAFWSPSGLRVAFNSILSQLDEKGNEFRTYTVKVADVLFDDQGLPAALAGVRVALELNGTVGLSWAPDNRRVTFMRVAPGRSDSDIHVADVDRPELGSTAVTTSLDNDSYPSFSPDGQRIAFSRNVDARSSRRADIFTMPSGGGSATRVTSKFNVANTLNQQPRWSPDGADLAFQSRQDSGSLYAHVHRIDAAGATKSVNLTPRTKAHFSVTAWR